MKKILKISSCFLALLLPLYAYAELSGLPKSKSPSDSVWNTISDEVINNAKYSHMMVFAEDKNGVFYEGGVYYDNPTTYSDNCHWIIRKSLDRAHTWTTIDDYYIGPKIFPTPNKFIIDKNGNFFIIGSTLDINQNQVHAFIRCSIDSGKSWKNIDILQGSYSFPHDIQITSEGMIYILGTYQEKDNYFNVIIRSTDQAETWSVISKRDSIHDGLTELSEKFIIDPEKNIYEFGRIFDYPIQKQITSYVRKSSDEGKTWTTIDNFMYDNEKFTYPSAAILDSDGNIYETLESGSNGLNFPSHWLVRKGCKDGTWKTIDDYVYPEGNENNSPTTIAFDENGVLFVSGIVIDNNRVKWMIRMSNDKGAHWSLMNVFDYDLQKHYTAIEKIFLSFSKENSMKNVYAIGTITLETQNHWLTRKFSGI